MVVSLNSRLESNKVEDGAWGHGDETRHAVMAICVRYVAIAMAPSSWYLLDTGVFRWI